VIVTGIGGRRLPVLSITDCNNQLELAHTNSNWLLQICLRLEAFVRSPRLAELVECA
jgi:hypothetical protein